MQYVRIAATCLLVVVLIVVIFTPSVYYPPTQRTILYLVASLLIGLLVGAETTTQFKLDLKWFSFVSVGSAALVIFLCWWLTYLSKPDVKMAVYQIRDEKGNTVDLNWAGAVELPTMPNGTKANAFIRGSEIVLIYPEQLEQQTLRIRKTPDDPGYETTVSFAGVRQFTLSFGKELSTSK